MVYCPGAAAAVETTRSPPQDVFVSGALSKRTRLASATLIVRSYWALVARLRDLSSNATGHVRFGHDNDGRK